MRLNLCPQPWWQTRLPGEPSHPPPHLFYYLYVLMRAAKICSPNKIFLVNIIFYFSGDIGTSAKLNQAERSQRGR